MQALTAPLSTPRQAAPPAARGGPTRHPSGARTAGTDKTPPLAAAMPRAPAPQAPTDRPAHVRLTRP